MTNVKSIVADYNEVAEAIQVFSQQHEELSEQGKVAIDKDGSQTIGNDLKAIRCDLADLLRLINEIDETELREDVARQLAFVRDRTEAILGILLDTP
jgi:hypothetical protein